MSFGDFDYGGVISFNEKGDVFYFFVNCYIDNELKLINLEVYKLSLSDLLII